MSLKQFVHLSVNGEVHEVVIAPNRTLLEVLREELGLTGTKWACGRGGCGACTVLVNGRSILSCMTLAIEVQGKEILTIEGLAPKGDLHPVQEAFIEHFAVQCGFCSPGMILSAKALLDKNPHPSEEEIKEGIAGNLCRCTGYVKIVEAIMAVAGKDL